MEKTSLTVKFGENLKKVLKEKKTSQKELSDKIGVAQSTVSRWINGERYPSLEYLLAIINALNILSNELIPEEDDDSIAQIDTILMNSLFGDSGDYFSIGVLDNLDKDKIADNIATLTDITAISRAHYAIKKNEVIGYRLESKEGIFDNSILLFEWSNHFKDKDIVIARLKNKEIIIGTVVFLEDNILINLSEDKNITRTFRRDEISLLGKVHLIVKVLR